MTKLEELIKQQQDYVAKKGGFHEILEADTTYNDLNRKQIAAFKEQYGSAYLGSINYYDEQRKKILAGTESIFKEYTGQMVYNFGCAFCVPRRDMELEYLVRSFLESNDQKTIDRIFDRIERLGGLIITWY
ncbi:hypothetical protein [Paenibacillus macerans]|uniref:Uncharacterized protein n=1 Tax=Paenibacillus macerans TaxID=44252 RepID=A0A090YLN0_PAEMA|nr:hypothetical protein [Paenibacillus macerans]KFM93050.1 hypothetical protein DJ90_2942 [Paenibacillus macerans]MCY7558556.1 hypothetical protein [Paenibacillus macerans]MEC0153936.1 hypothetical protein [Paenibacillus macerans]SUA84792.1 Uncharacterised protein [Paenibacillus macerans]